MTAGTAILSKQKALSVDYTLPGHPDPKYTKGRIITLEFEGTYLVGTYVPNAGVGLKVRCASLNQSKSDTLMTADIRREKSLEHAF